MPKEELVSDIDEDDFLVFEDEKPIDALRKHHWRILVVDDDEAIHSSTRFVLSDFTFEGCEIDLLHAYNTDEAKELLENNTNIAVILLDVVMETDDAGLKLVDFVRNEMHNKNMRIILRTGQPGAAPEWEVITKYDINDYKTKTELTQEKLFTTLTTAFRSYQQLYEITANRRGLEEITQNNAALLKTRSIEEFWEQTKSFISSLFPVTDDYLFLLLDRMNSISIKCVESAGSLSTVPMDCSLRILPEDISVSIENAMSSRNIQIRNKDITLFLETSKNQKLIIYYKLSRSLTDGEARLLNVFISNASVALDNICLFENVQSLAYEDQLTGLRNRSAFVDELRSLLRSINEGDEYIVIDVDLDHFDDINDLIGQRHGDKVLQAFAHHIEHIAGPTKALCRISGDEFGLIYKTKGIGATNFDPRKILQDLQHKININAYDISLRSSIGIAKFSDKAQTAETILRNAWLALRRAKDSGRNGFAYYSSDMDFDVVKRAELTSNLRQAIEKEEFSLFYQPQYCFESEAICGVEALLRWKKKDGSFMPPVEFIPALERSGLIVEVGEWILRQSCIDAQSWVGSELENVAVSVNVSVVQLYKPNFVDMVSKTLEVTGLAPQRLKLEITESIIMHDAEDASKILANIQALGISVAIDDFGVGYSSLSYLQKLPVDYIKVDQSFVENIVGQPGDAMIADAIITLGHSFGLKVVAEGVEDDDQVKFLRILGCDQIQGYYYALPMSQSDLLKFPLNKKI